jgi:multidrug efflux pump subunit AcrA (membrane-fusion protein)
MNVDIKITPRTLLVFVFALGLASCSGGEQTTTAAAGGDPLAGFVPAVSATGVVRPSTWATLSFQGGGLVEEVLVERGDQVEAGQVLVELGGSEQVHASLTAARLEQVSAQQALDALIENADLAEAQAQLALARASDALEEAEYDWQVLQPGYRASGDTIDAAEANLVLANEEVDRAQQAHDHASGEAGKALALSNLIAARKQRDSIQRNLNWYLGSPTEIDQAIQDAELAQAKAQLASAEREYAKVENGPDPDALELAEARLAAANAAVAAAERALANTELRADFAGMVSEIYVRAGESVGPGQPIVLLADLSELIVETTDLNEIDVARVAVGDAALVTFDALPDVELQGTLSYIASKADPGTGVNYLVEVKVADGFPEGVRWGMTAYVEVEVGE